MNLGEIQKEKLTTHEKVRLFVLFYYDCRQVYYRWCNLRSETNKLRILGESLLISSLPGKALRTLADIASLAEI